MWVQIVGEICRGKLTQYNARQGKYHGVIAHRTYQADDVLNHVRTLVPPPKLPVNAAATDYGAQLTFGCYSGDPR